MRSAGGSQTQNVEQEELMLYQMTFNEFVQTQIAQTFSLAGSNGIAQEHVNRSAGD